MVRCQEECIQDPSDTDILCGKDYSIYQHKGNHKFRSVIKENVGNYIEAPNRSARSTLVRAVYAELVKTGCRFLRKSDNGCDCWNEINDVQAKDKVGHAFRDRVPRKDSKKATVKKPPAAKRKRRAKNQSSSNATSTSNRSVITKTIKGTTAAQLPNDSIAFRTRRSAGRRQLHQPPQQQQQQELEQEESKSSDNSKPTSPSRMSTRRSRASRLQQQKPSVARVEECVSSAVLDTATSNPTRKRKSSRTAPPSLVVADTTLSSSSVLLSSSSSLLQEQPDFTPTRKTPRQISLEFDSSNSSLDLESSKSSLDPMLDTSESSLDTSILEQVPPLHKSKDNHVDENDDDDDLFSNASLPEYTDADSLMSLDDDSLNVVSLNDDSLDDDNLSTIFDDVALIGSGDGAIMPPQAALLTRELETLG